jgi:large subunit ribosomal protein L9
MKVILMERVEKLGLMGDVVTVKPGYARNYLLPQKKALRASEENLAYFESQRHQLEADNLKQRDEASAVGGKLDSLVVVMIRQAGDSGQLYGSVNARDLAEAITTAGFTVDRKQVVLEKAIKVLGLHPVKIRLHPEVVVEVTANVARSETEAERQAQTGHMVSAEEQRETEEAAVEAIVAEVEETEQAEAAEAETASTEESEAEAASSEESEAETRA